MDHLRFGNRERGDVLVGWLTRLLVVFAMLGVVGYDVISIGVAKAAASDHAVTAALEASSVYFKTKDVDLAAQAAAASAAENGDEVVPGSFVVLPGGRVELAIRRTAGTLIVRHVGAIQSWATVTGSGEATSIG